MDPPARLAQEEQDAAFARRLAQTEDFQSPYQSTSALPRPSQMGERNFSIRSGQRAPVRLHHPSTKNHIGEIFHVQYLSSQEVIFELANSPGKNLRVDESAKVDFAETSDDHVKFRFQVTPEGNIYLLCSAHLDKLNNAGERGWYLALNPDGSLVGDSSKCPLSQWVLVAAADPPGATAHNAPPPTSSAMPYGSRRQEQPVASNSSGPLFGGIFGGWSSESREGYSHVPSDSASSTNPLLATGLSQPLPAPTANPTRGSTITTTPPPEFRHTYTPQSQSATSAPSFSNNQVSGILCAHPNEQLIWLSTHAGQEFLASLASQTPASMLRQGTLRSLLYRPDWPYVCDAYVAAMAAPKESYNATLATAACPEAKQRRFFEEGYTVLNGVIPNEFVSTASKLVSYWASSSTRARIISHGPGAGSGGRVELQGEISRDFQIMRIFSNTALFHVAQLLIGVDEVAPVTASSIHVYYPSLEPPSSNIPVRSPGCEWVIEGFTTHGGHSPYTLLIGVPLTDMSDPFSGNLCLHSSSHIFLQDSFRAQVAGSSDSFSQPGSSGKPELPECPPLLLNRGDAFMCTHKCAISYLSNCQEDCTKIAFFKLSHIDHEGGMKEMALDFPWCEYRGVDILEKVAPPSAAAGFGLGIDLIPTTLMPPPATATAETTWSVIDPPIYKTTRL